jgi:hypothetical protein
LKLAEAQPSQSNYLHPDDTYWPSEKLPDQVDTELPRSLETTALPVSQDPQLHPDDAYWPTSDDASDPPSVSTNDKLHDQVDVAKNDTGHVENWVAASILPPEDPYDLNDEEDESSFIVSTPFEALESPTGNDAASFGGLEEFDFESYETAESSEDSDEVNIDWIYDLEDDLPNTDTKYAFPEAGEDIPAWRITQWATFMVDMLPPGTTRQRNTAFDTLCALLEEFPHGASAKAIARQIDAGATLDNLLRSAHLKRLWQEDEGLWLRRDYRNGIRTCSSQRHAMTWAIAGRLIADHVPGTLEEALLGDWRQAWMEMNAPEAGERASPSWFSYAASLEGDHSGWTTDMTTLLGTTLETGWAYTAPASRSDFQDRTAGHPHIVAEARSTVSRIVKPTLYEER